MTQAFRLSEKKILVLMSLYKMQYFDLEDETISDGNLLNKESNWYHESQGK